MHKRHLLILFVVLFAALLITPLPSYADSDKGSDSGKGRGIIVKRDAAEQFIVLPRGVAHPEGITANPHNGDLFVGTFDFSANNQLLRFDRRGRLLASKSFGGTPLLGLEFNPRDGNIYICNFGLSRIQRIRGDFTASTTVEDVATIPLIGALAPRIVSNPPDGSSSDTIIFNASFAAPNALAFNSVGDLFVSDSFQGAIFKVDHTKIAQAGSCLTLCNATLVTQDPLLTTVGFPPFGANGLAFSADGATLFIANTGDDRVLQMNVSSKSISPFAESINGADGMTFDRFGRLWVCANQADEIVALSATGRVIAKLGDFLGINKDLTPRGLLFPASNVIVGDEMFVTNLAIALTGGDEPEADVMLWTISRIHLPGPDEH